MMLPLCKQRFIWFAPARKQDRPKSPTSKHPILQIAVDVEGQVSDALQLQAMRVDEVNVGFSQGPGKRCVTPQDKGRSQAKNAISQAKNALSLAKGKTVDCATNVGQAHTVYALKPYCTRDFPIGLLELLTDEFSDIANHLAFSLLWRRQPVIAKPSQR
jgi:hypothetical protein